MIMRAAVSMSLVLVAVVIVVAADAEPWNDEERLVSDLWLAGRYDAGTRPVRNSSQAVQVDLRVDIFGILSLDSKTQEITALSAFNMKWRDERLKWNPDVYNGLEYLSVPAGKAWHPGVTVLNAFDETRLIAENAEMLVTSEGVLHVGTTLIHSTRCYLNQKAFPFDIQNCTFLIGTENTPSNSLRIAAVKAETPREQVRTIDSWVLESITVDGTQSPSCINYYDTSSASCLRTSQVSVNVTVRREPKYYVTTVLAPCTLLTLLASMIFWLPPECGEKISFGISILFGFVVFQLVVQDALFETGADKPSILIRFVLFNFVLVGVAVMISAVSIALHHKGDVEEASRGMDCCKKCAPHVEVDDEALSQTPEDDAMENQKKLNSKKRNPRNWKKIAKILDRVSFVLYYVAYVVFVGVLAGEAAAV